MWLQSAVVVVFRRDVQFICLPLLYFPWPPLLDVSGENIKIQRSRRFTCLSTEVLQTACLLQKVPILRKKELPACSAVLWWLSALLRGNDTLSRAGGIFLWR